MLSLKLEAILDKAYSEGRNALTEPEAYDFLKAAGFDILDYTLLKDKPKRRDLKKHSEKVVMKIVSPDILHKTEIGGVMFVKNGLKEVKKAYSEILKNVKEKAKEARIEGVMLTNFVPDLEDRKQLLVSCRHDNYLGPVINIGQGGIYVELDNDVSSRIVPSAEKELSEMVHETKISKKIFGYRNQKKLIEENTLIKFLAGLDNLSLSFSGLTLDSKYNLEDLEINPLAVTQEKLFPIDCLIKFRKKEEPLLLEQEANIKNLDNLLCPKSIAVIGASPKPEKLGYIIFKNLLKSKIPVYAVNVKGEEVLGHKIYRSVKDVAKEFGEVDLAVLTIPANLTPDAMRDMAGSVKSAILIPGGFGELGEKGKSLEEDVSRIAAESGIRIIGPNCVGVKSFCYNSFFIPDENICFNEEAEKNISLVTQSGSVSVSFSGMSNTVGIRHVISCGNMLDVDIGDLVSYLDKEEETKVIAVYAESLKNARKFYNATKLTKKPVVVLKAGKCKEARKATMSHTGAIADDNEVFDVAVKQANAINTENFQEFLDYCKAFSLMYNKEVKGNKVVLISNGGGALVNATDELRHTSLELAELSKETISKLDEFSDHITIIQNPLDLAGMADNSYYTRSLEHVLAQDNVDGVVLCVIPFVESINDKTIASEIEEVIKKYKKPVVATHMAGPNYAHVAKNFDKIGVPCYEEAERAVKALDAFICYKLKKA